MDQVKLDTPIQCNKNQHHIIPVFHREWSQEKNFHTIYDTKPKSPVLPLNFFFSNNQ